MTLSDLFLRFGIALGLGLLVGLQRERSDSVLGGVRTFALVTVAGALLAVLGRELGGWIVAAGLVALAGLMVVNNLARMKAESGTIDPGLTSEVAMLAMFAVGALAVVGPLELATVVGATVAVLLYWKEQLHSLARRIGDDDFRAMMQFALLSLVILPVLPDRTFGPYEVLNPREIWWMVVLIVGLGLAGYLGYKMFGERAGTVLAGALGGAVSSTATTVSSARRSAAEPEAADAAALVVLIASSVVFLRVLVEVAVVAPAFLPVAAVPMLSLLAVMVLLVLLMWRRHTREDTQQGRPKGAPAENPSELKPAILFALLYAVVLLAVEGAHRHLGDAGLYAVAALSGLTDMDAITLSTSKLVSADRLEPAIGAKAILLATLSNLVFKAGVVMVIGSRRLIARIAFAFGVVLAVGVTLLVLL